mmetsp:Transcript_42893/g.80515  ORF Transcript_42893/g.80515 Transcript_42893/m.80515 type:complete len:523 (-) Transcript_42893:86-1654(-)
MMRILDFRVSTILVILASFECSTAESTRADDEISPLASAASSGGLPDSGDQDAVCFLSKSWTIQRGSKSLAQRGKSSVVAPKLRGWGVEVSKHQESDCPVALNIRGAEDVQDKRMGSFAKTEIMPSDLHAQRPIYVNKNQQYLYYWAEFDAWRIGPDYTKEEAGLTSLSNHLAGCPMQAKDWHAWDGKGWKRKHVTALSQLEAGSVDVHYGIFTSPLEKYAAQLDAVLHTWGRDVPPGKLTVVGVNGTNPNVSYKPAPNCKDGHVWNNGISCKEATLLVEGHRSGADWMVVVGSDNFVLPRNFEEELSGRNPEVPEILAIWGCGAGLYCEDLQGGLCGGGGYAISRRALDLMVGEGHKSEQAFIKESKKTATEVCGYWSDQVTSCIARRRGVREVQLMGLQGWRICEENSLLDTGEGLGVDCPFDQQLYGQALQDSNILPLTFHYIEPEEMYTLYEMQKEIEGWKAESLLIQISAHEGKGRAREDAVLKEAAAAYERNRAAYVKEINTLLASGNFSRLARHA